MAPSPSNEVDNCNDDHDNNDDDDHGFFLKLQVFNLSARRVAFEDFFMPRVVLILYSAILCSFQI